jgi:hypothetical protein
VALMIGWCGGWLGIAGLRALSTLSTTLGSGAGEDEIERIRREFEDAKRNYLSIPVAIKDMAKMNPQGLSVCSFYYPHPLLLAV